MRMNRKIKAGLLAVPVLATAALASAQIALAAQAADIETGQLLDRGRFPRTVAFRNVVTDHTILISSDLAGQVRLIGMEQGDYEAWPVRLSSDAPASTPSLMKIETDDRIAMQVRFTARRAEAAGTSQPEPGAKAMPLVSLEAISFDASPVGQSEGSPKAGSVIDLRRVFQISPPAPCARPVPGKPNTCGVRSRNHIDVNASPAEEIMRLAPRTGRAAAAAIIAERTRGGAFKDVIDFAQRICPTAKIDFSGTSARMGTISIAVAVGGGDAARGFSCAPKTGTLVLFGKKHNYVGHVTLLR